MVAMNLSRSVREGAVATRAAGGGRRASRAHAARAVGQERREQRRGVCDRVVRGKGVVLAAAAAAEASEAEVESRSTLRIKLKCYSSEPLQVRLR